MPVSVPSLTKWEKPDPTCRLGDFDETMEVPSVNISREQVAVNREKEQS